MLNKEHFKQNANNNLSVGNRGKDPIVLAFYSKKLISFKIWQFH
jgi:hypothetical protein